MSKAMPNPTALRQMVITAAVAFFVGFVGVLVMWAWFLSQHQTKDMSWWQIFDMVMHTIHIITFAVIGGLLATLAATRAVSWVHVRLGMYECPLCGRAFRVRSMLCECRQSRPMNPVQATGTEAPASDPSRTNAMSHL
jgi:hypothetical protein